MTWSLHCHLIMPESKAYGTVLNEYVEVVGPYLSQNQARFWAVAFMERGSLSVNQGLPNEELLPASSVTKIEILEDE